MVEFENSPGRIYSPPPRLAAEPACRPAPFVEGWQKPVFILCLLGWIGNLVLTALRIEHSKASAWLEALFLLFATVSSLLGLGRRLPLQNVLATAILIAGISAAVIS